MNTDTSTDTSADSSAGMDRMDQVEQAAPEAEVVEAPEAVEAGEMEAEEQAIPEVVEGYPARLTVADGFRFGCGFLLAFVAFNFVLAMLVATVILLAMLLNLPLPFGIP